MHLYIYDKLNKEFMKTEVELEKETPKMLYIKPSEYEDRLRNLMTQVGEASIHSLFSRAVHKDELPIVSMGLWYRDDPSSGAMFVLSANELSLEEVKNLLNREVNSRVRQQESAVQKATERLSALNQISADVGDLDEITDLDNEEEEKEI